MYIFAYFVTPNIWYRLLYFISELGVGGLYYLVAHITGMSTMLQGGFEIKI